MTFGEKLKKLRIRKGMTQKDLSAATGLARTSISNYENNRQTPKCAAMNALAAELDVPFSELFACFITPVDD